MGYTQNLCYNFFYLFHYIKVKIMKIKELFKLPAVYNKGIFNAVSIEKQHQILLNNYINIKKYIELLEIKKEDNYTEIVLLIPSEVFLDKLKYMVIFRLYPDSKGNITPNSMVKVFCNEPTFMFRDAFVYNEQGLLINDYKKYLSEKALKQSPKTTNPNKRILVVKSIIYALLYLRDIKFFEKKEIKSYKQNTYRILHTEDILKLYNQYKKKYKKIYSDYKKGINKTFTFHY